MSFLNPLGLFALAAVPAVLALHFFRRRLRERRAAGLFLFGAENLPADAGRTRTTLLRTPSLWLELLAATALGLLCGGLSLDAQSRREHLVIVLDDSASMQAVQAGTSAADRARRAIERLIAESGRDLALTVVLTADRPELMFGPRGAAPLVDDALGKWLPQRPRHDPARALSLALEMADPADRIVFVTDEPPSETPPRVAVIGVGVAAANDAILSARRLRKSATEETVLVDVVALGGGPRRSSVRLLSGDSAATSLTIAETALELEPGKIGRAAFTVARSEDVWKVALPGDGLTIDDEAVLLPEPRRPVRIATLLGEESNALLRLDRAFAALEDVKQTGNPLDADLVFAPAPGKLERGAVECVVETPGDARDDWVGPFLFDRRHPLTNGLSLQGVVWSAATESPPGRALVLAGDRALLTEEEGAAGTRLRLNLDPRRSNLPNALDWPVLLANLVDRTRRGLPGPVAVNVRVGEELVWRLRGGVLDPARYSLLTPDGRTLDGRGLRSIGFSAETPGIHRLLRDQVEIARFAVRFADARESDLTALSSRSSPAAEAPRAVDDRPGQDGAARTERRFLALLVLAAIMADWFLLRRGGSA